MLVILPNEFAFAKIGAASYLRYFIISNASSVFKEKSSSGP
jgi:hypothetical protein